MIEIKKEELIKTLKNAYAEFKEYSDQNKETELIFARGFCRALEQIALIHGKFTTVEIAELKRPIIGNVSMLLESEVDLDTPAYLRKK
jgi:hypothetical protein